MNKRPIWIIHGFVTGEVCVLSQATVPPTKNEVEGQKWFSLPYHITEVTSTKKLTWHHSFKQLIIPSN